MACRILSARRYSADCATHGRFGIDEYQQSPICPGQEGEPMERLNLQLLERYDRVVSERSTEPRERQAARAIEAERAREASTYVRPVSTRPTVAALVTVGVALALAALILVAALSLMIDVSPITEWP